MDEADERRAVRRARKEELTRTLERRRRAATLLFLSALCGVPAILLGRAAASPLAPDAAGEPSGPLPVSDSDLLMWSAVVLGILSVALFLVVLVSAVRNGEVQVRSGPVTRGPDFLFGDSARDWKNGRRSRRRRARRRR